MKKKIIIGVLLVICGLGAGFFSLFAFADAARYEVSAANSRTWAAKWRALEPAETPSGNAIEGISTYEQLQAEADAHLRDAESADDNKEVATILAWSLVAGGVVLVGVAVLLFVSAARANSRRRDPNATVVIQHI